MSSLLSGLLSGSFLSNSFLSQYFLRRGVLANVGLLLLRVAIGTMMIHHGQEKLANPEFFATNYVVPLHLPFPLLMAHLAGFAEIFGSWCVILGVFSPLGAIALAGTMTVAAYHHILTSGFNIYVLELVVLYLGGSAAILLVGPGRFSFDAGMIASLLKSPSAPASVHSSVRQGPGALRPIPAEVFSGDQRLR
jgi:putative oxidoreductase